MQILDFIPSELQDLKDPVKRLYFRGNKELLKNKKISVVGSRKISSYTKDLILRLCSSLSRRGVCVVSGAALGCDINAHRGAFPNTIAVFGNGLNKFYPIANKAEIEKIYSQGLALSEYEPDEMPTKYSFLERNRIVVALGEALILAQADFKSGSMQSARLALESGKKIYVLPQRYFESQGSNYLLGQNKAELIYDIEKFVDFFAPSPNLFQDEKSEDELLKFALKNPNLQENLNKFGDLVYEYELLGRIEIDGFKIRVL